MNNDTEAEAEASATLDNHEGEGARTVNRSSNRPAPPTEGTPRCSVCGKLQSDPTLTISLKTECRCSPRPVASPPSVSEDTALRSERVLKWVAKQSAVMLGTIVGERGVQIHWLPATGLGNCEPTDFDPRNEGWRHGKGAETAMDAFLAAMEHDRRVSLGLIQEVELRTAPPSSPSTGDTK